MQIDLLEYKENSDKESNLLGHASVEIGGRMNAWFVIVKSKKGQIFCNPASIRIDGEFHPSFSLKKDEVMKKMCMDILLLVGNKYNLEEK